MLKIYRIGNDLWQFEESEAPAGAVPVEDEQTETKEKVPANKVKATKKK